MKRKLALLAAIAAIAICSGTCAVDARNWTVDQIRALIGQHFWPKSRTNMDICQKPEWPCPLSPGYFGKRQGFTVLGFVPGPYGIWAYAQIRADDGTTGLLRFSDPDTEWETEDSQARELRELNERLARFRAESDARLKKSLAEINANSERERKCAAGKPVIGMSKTEALKVWCEPSNVNTTETAGGTREQWVFKDRGYLYFENGVLVAIQRRN
jgi:hypothetical protein